MSHTFGEPYAISKDQAAERKRKRLLSRSDEEIAADMDKKNVPYRRGWPDLQSLPLNTVSRFVDKIFSVAQQDDILAKAREIFAAQRLSTGIQRVVFRVPGNVNRDGSTNLSPYITFLFTADMVNDAERIDRVVVQIRQNFMKIPAFNQVNIECLHIGCLVRPPTYAISPNDISVRSKSMDVIDFVIQRLEKERCPWLCIEIVRRGLVKNMDRCPPTILITTPTANESRWYTVVLPGIRKVLAKEAPAFQIELLRADSLSGAHKQYPPTDTVNGTSYEQNVHMGSSVGTESDEHSGGTLGGFVTLDGGGQPRVQCGITNWHVVRDDSLNKDLTPKSGALEPNNQTLSHKQHHMVTPSTQDHHGYLGNLQRQMKNFADISAEGDPDARAMWNSTNTQYTKIATCNRRIGHVHAGSVSRSMRAPRYATDPETGGKDKEKTKTQLRFSLDWALIKVANSTGRVPLNTLPNKDPPITAGTNLTASFFCNKWSTFNVDKDMVRVAKVGRTSSWTFGNISSQICAINPDDLEFKEMTELYGFTAADPGYCFQVIPDPDAKDFMELGDSGSILLHDKSGAWLGLLFGATGAGHGLFIPINRVFQDIKSVTGQEVQVPSFIQPDKIDLAPYQLEPSD